MGKGVYIASNIVTPLIHAHPSPGWSNRAFKAELACVALCKAANKAVFREYFWGEQLVVKEENVIVRCILVYEEVKGFIPLPSNTSAAAFGTLLEGTKEYQLLFGHESPL